MIDYRHQVSAVDGSWRAETPLTITVQDQNDNAPEFEHSFYSFNLAELQRSVAFVGQVRNCEWLHINNFTVKRLEFRTIRLITKSWRIVYRKLIVNNIRKAAFLVNFFF